MVKLNSQSLWRTTSRTLVTIEAGEENQYYCLDDLYDGDRVSFSHKTTCFPLEVTWKDDSGVPGQYHGTVTL
jgi:hypothetical protein